MEVGPEANCSKTTNQGQSEWRHLKLVRRNREQLREGRGIVMKGPKKLATIVHGSDGSQRDEDPNMVAKVRTWRL